MLTLYSRLCRTSEWEYHSCAVYGYRRYFTRQPTERSHQTIEVIRKLSAFMPVVLASSRMPSAMRHFQNALGILRHPLICYNVGYVIRYNSAGEADVLSSAHIPLTICEDILTLANTTSVHISLYQQDTSFRSTVDE